MPNPRTGQPMTATGEQAHMQATFAEMKKYNIVKAFVSNQYAAVLRWQPEAVGLAVEGIESATFLTAEQRRDIFYNNAVRFFRLDKK